MSTNGARVALLNHLHQALLHLARDQWRQLQLKVHTSSSRQVFSTALMEGWHTSTSSSWQTSPLGKSSQISKACSCPTIRRILRLSPCTTGWQSIPLAFKAWHSSKLETWKFGLKYQDCLCWITCWQFRSYRTTSWQVVRSSPSHFLPMRGTSRHTCLME